MKKAILVLVIVAVAAVIVLKLAGRRSDPQPPPASSLQASSSGKPVFYLFHDPSDQDAGCRRIYAFADRCETELAGKVEVKRPDVEREKTLVEQYQVRVLPTILLVSPTGSVEERFEGEDKATAARIEQALDRLKVRAQ